MIVLHTADWHLGNELYGHDRTEEHGIFLRWLERLVSERDVDALIVAGDIYHTTNPSVRAQRALLGTISSLQSRCPMINIVLTGGNHDSPARLELPRALLDERRTKIIGAAPKTSGELDLDAMIAPLTDADDIVRAVCVAAPFLRAGDLGASVNADADALRTFHEQAVARARHLHPNAAVILTGHLSVTGADVSSLSERRILVGGSETVSSSVFPATADYVALGHLHRPQTLSGPTQIRYAGAPLPMSAAEREYRHSVTLLHIEAGAEGSRIETEIVEAPRPAPFLRIPERGAAPLEEIEAALAALDLDEKPPGLRPFLEIAVKLDAPTPDLRARLDAALGEAPVRLARILRDHGETGTAAAAAPQDLRALTPEQTFSRLYDETYGGVAPAPLLDAFRDLIAEVEIGVDEIAPNSSGDNAAETRS